MDALTVLDTLVFLMVLGCAFLLGVIVAWLVGSREFRERGWWRGYEERARAAGQRHAILHEDTQALVPVNSEVLRGVPGFGYTPRHGRDRPRFAITMG